MQQIINFIEHQAAQSYISYDKGEKSFSIDLKHDTVIEVRFSLQDINFSFLNTHGESFSFRENFNKVKSLMNIIFNHYYEQEANYYLTPKKLEFKDVQIDVAFVYHYLKITNLDIEKQKPDFSTELKHGNKEYCLLIGKNYSKDRFDTLTHPFDIIEFAVSISEPKNPHIYFKHKIPAWKIADYKAYEFLQAPKISSMDEFAKKISALSPVLGQEFKAYNLSEHLQTSLPVRTPEKKAKI